MGLAELSDGGKELSGIPGDGTTCADASDTPPKTRATRTNKFVLQRHPQRVAFFLKETRFVGTRMETGQGNAGIPESTMT